MTSPGVVSENMRASVDERLNAILVEARRRACELDAGAVGLWDELLASVAGGKRLRPRLVIEPYIALGGREFSAAIEVAVAMELLHSALLLHDDVIDGDLDRRGGRNLIGRHRDAALAVGLDETRARRWGESSAIIGGDLLLAAAVQVVALLDLDRDRRARLLRLLDDALLLAAAGEQADVAFSSGVWTPQVADLRRMMRGKTAGYSFEIPLSAAAVLAGAEEAVIQRLAEIGRGLGVLFQLQDDLLGVFGNEAETGKSTISDLREGKQTLLVAYARGTKAWDRAAPELFGSATLDEAGAERLRQALIDSGARARVDADMAVEVELLDRLITDEVLPERLAGLLRRELQRARGRRA